MPFFFSNAPVKRAARGAQFLDDTVPEWWNEVDVRKLDMGRHMHCVLGQIYGGYRSGCRELGFSSFGIRSIRNGFFTLRLSGRRRADLYYQKLTHAWRDEILKRFYAEAELS